MDFECVRLTGIFIRRVIPIDRMMLSATAGPPAGHPGGGP
jgi:hypothetical protein